MSSRGRFVTSFLLMALLTACSAASALGQVSFIVRLADEAPASLLNALEDIPAGQDIANQPLFEGVESATPLFDVGTAIGKGDLVRPPNAYRIVVADSAAFFELEQRWSTAPGVAYVQPNFRYRLDAFVYTSAAESDSLHHLDVIRVRDAWSITRGDPSIRIGFVDTGVYFGHPSFEGQFWLNPGEVQGSGGCRDPGHFTGRDDDGNGFIDDVCGYNFVDRVGSVDQGNYRGRSPDASEDPSPGMGRGHGTIIAGLIAARGSSDSRHAIGVAPGSRLVPLRAFGADGIGEDADVSAAIVYAAQMGFEVLNLSFGDAVYSRLMHEAIQYAVARGTVVVASAGNVGGDHPHYPSDYPEVISAVWLGSEGRSVAGRASHGVGVDIGAPGTAIYSTLFPPNERLVLPSVHDLYGRRSGSSVSAAIVSGAAALVKSVAPDLSPEAVRSILAGTAVDIADPGWDHRSGGGRLDVFAAVTAALPARVEITSPAHQEGVSSDEVEIRGTAVSPLFDSFSVMFAAGDENPDGRWQPIAGPVHVQQRDALLATWNVSALPDGPFYLRLMVQLRDGRTVEDRRRVFVQRNAPQLEVIALAPVWVAGRNGILADVQTGDVTEARLEVTVDGKTHAVPSNLRAHRHGMVWVNESLDAMTVSARVVVRNTAGLETASTPNAIGLNAVRTNAGFMEEATLNVPQGHLLPFATDFDRDGLKEIVLNVYEDGWLGDTLAVYEWDGSGFTRAHAMIASVFPRDVGDTRGNGLDELLTQVSGATILFEQEHDTGFPTNAVFYDTTGLSNPTAETSMFGARLFDFDGDGHDEILTHNTQEWRIFKYSDGGYAEVARLENPTSYEDSEVGENVFQEPKALIADFTGNGRVNILAGDGDGDLIMYESASGFAFEPIWTHEMRRYNAGARFAKGDFLGDGTVQFWTYTSSWPGLTLEREYEPQYGVYHLWHHTGGNTFAVVDSIVAAGGISRHGTLSAGDFTGDGVDELVLIHPPDLYIFSHAGGWEPIYHRGAVLAGVPSGMRSMEAVVADFRDLGRPQIVAAEADGSLRMFTPSGVAPQHAPPVFVNAYPVDESSIYLEWRAPGADSVAVFGGAAGEPLSLIQTQADSSFVDVEVTAARRYVLRAWYGGEASGLSGLAQVRPEPAISVASVDYPAARHVRIRFTRRLSEPVTSGQFGLADGTHPESAFLEMNNYAVNLRFDALGAVPQGLLWNDLRDEWGAPVPQLDVEVAAPPAADRSLILASWEILDEQQVRLTFSEPVDASEARDIRNYRMQPAGEVAAVEFSDAEPADVIVRIAGRAIGATGLATSLVVVSMRAQSGALLAPEGNVALLTEPANDLTDAYVFPNPFREEQHAPQVMIAGLPSEASIEILSVHGTRVRSLHISGSRGGAEWDLTDENGVPVPSGVYLFRISSPGSRPVLIKGAVIR